jgi:F-type H+-transporting ATPase subunit a
VVSTVFYCVEHPTEQKQEAIMEKQKKVTVGMVLGIVLAVLLIGILFTNQSGGKSESIQEVMKDAVLHETGKISLFGIKEVNPALISAMTMTVILLIVAGLIRIFVIPKFQYIPGKFQMILEELVGMFDGLAKSNSPHRNRFLGAYVFAAGVYIFTSTLFELFGLQAVNVSGHSITLPAPLSDINAAIAMGCLSYGIILSGGIAGNRWKGVVQTLKDFSLPISMSFRLFGALLSGLLVTELVYYYIQLSFLLPVVVGVLFTLLHALIQAYVLTMLTALFYGEVSEPQKKQKK